MDQSLLEAELSQLAKHCSIQQGTVYSPSRYAYLNQNRELFKCWKGVKWGGNILCIFAYETETGVNISVDLMHDNLDLP